MMSAVMDRTTGIGARTWVRRFAWATLVANIGIVVTGGAVRLSGSGLGCPTWPRCHDGSFTPHGELNLHSAIEFGNRTLTFVLTAIAIATFVSALGTGRRDLRRLALLLALSVPAQAVLGGITVLTDLNPWVVAFHLLFSMGIISLAVLYVHRTEHPASAGEATRRHTVVAWSTYAAAWVVLALGTVVTGSGPHAGDVNAPRNGLDPLQLSQLHADFVFLLVGLTVALVIVHPSRTTWTLLGVELAQGLIGFVQYFTDLPAVLVGFHLLGASLVAAAATWVLIEVREGSAPRAVSDARA
ncbi:MAG: Cytochrome oxidase assembly protein [Marmoricola sp.]|jgi:cytochrome c oxidase assembly protein subunit 15|nr:Cytochrome oxidase assembly protein [Marmoricola sp.]